MWLMCLCAFFHLCLVSVHFTGPSLLEMSFCRNFLSLVSFTLVMPSWRVINCKARSSSSPCLSNKFKKRGIDKSAITKKFGQYGLHIFHQSYSSLMITTPCTCLQFSNKVFHYIFQSTSKIFLHMVKTLGKSRISKPHFD